ncbi:hypothetical protein I552_4880 [Mycobacterium xenopi 3993]|nr:hypothetical protein I552_4880 [Mycobacterium xenopi 3993]
MVSGPGLEIRYGAGYLHRSYWRRTASAPGSSFTSPVTSLRVDADPGSASA